MARETSYFVQSFNAGKGGNLKADAPIACKSATGAVRTAERLALSKLGVVAFSSTGDPEMGDYDDEPTIIFRNGQFPAAFVRAINGSGQPYSITSSARTAFAVLMLITRSSFVGCSTGRSAGLVPLRILST